MFPNAVRLQPEVGVPGSRASMNPISVISRLAQTPVNVAAFVWPGTDTDNQVTNAGTGKPLGFAVRDESGIIPNYLQEYSMQVPQGFPVQVAQRGEFFASSAANVASLGQKVYANYGDGTLSFATSGAPSTNANITASTTSGSNVLTVSANTGANIQVGQPISGAGIPAGTYISALGTGTGGAGTYTMSQNASATGAGVTVTATLNVETPFVVERGGAAGSVIKISSWSDLA
ncbi:MAG: hypothetical protein EPN65_16735 [Pandoraea sp.]|uniref:structural cement protein Gp24 n=1 Tax=Pandoraea sp. TaxID=1883445 RepID=UPI00122A8754|nr:hypothetical protein [Pandoraea sp.]TAM15960.1 MAG: hypothetical protein EPN65_16735 [Pandoraea sp.]